MSGAAIRVAVIGAGVGRGHTEAFAALPDLFRVAAVCDLDRARAEAGAALAPGAAAVTASAEVLADPAIDLVDICLPPHLHFEATMAALDAGKHVICEKPFMTSMADTARVRARADEVGRRVIPVFQYRYGTGYRRLWELIRTGLAGRPHAISLETHWQRGAAYYAVPWRGTWAGESGGTIVSHATHIHNLATHLAGRIETVAALVDTRINPIETEDTVALAMRTDRGCLVTSSICLGAAGNTSRLRAVFDGVTAQSDVHPYMVGDGDWTFTAADPVRQGEIDAVIAPITGVPIRFAGLFRDVHATLTGGAEMYLPSLDEAAHSVELITAIYQSARSGTLVSLPLPATHPMAEGWRPAAEETA